MASALCFVFRIEAKVNQRVVPFARFHDDVTAASAITAGGASAGNKLLSPEGNTPVAAVPRLHPNSSFIDKHIFSVVSLFLPLPLTIGDAPIALAEASPYHQYEMRGTRSLVLRRI